VISPRDGVDRGRGEYRERHLSITHRRLVSDGPEGSQGPDWPRCPGAGGQMMDTKTY